MSQRRIAVEHVDDGSAQSEENAVSDRLATGQARAHAARGLLVLTRAYRARIIDCD
jgi:hypothetical protein